jgi:hypothetical protein
MSQDATINKLTIFMNNDIYKSIFKTINFSLPFLPNKGKYKILRVKKKPKIYEHVLYCIQIYIFCTFMCQ